VADRLLGGGSWHFYEPPELEVGEHMADSHYRDRAVIGDELVTSKATRRDLGNALRSLDRRSTQEFMDKGIWILYLAAGMLHWTDPDTGELAESPLVMIPVQLFRENPREPYELRRADEDVVLNPALGVKLAEFGIELPSMEEEEPDIATTLAEFDRADRPVFVPQGGDVPGSVEERRESLGTSIDSSSRRRSDGGLRP
jgi:hypothetical protein